MMLGIAIKGVHRTKWTVDKLCVGRNEPLSSSHPNEEPVVN